MDDPGRTAASGPEQRRAARGLARAGIGLLAAVVLACALLAALGLALARGFERQRLVAVLEAALGSALSTPVEIGSLSGSLYPELVLRDLRVGPPTAPLAEVDRLSLRWNAEEFLSLSGRGPLVVEMLELDGLQLHLHADADGRWNLPALDEAEGLGGAPLPPVRVRVARVVRSHVLIESEQWQSLAKTSPSADAPARLRASLEAEAYDVRLPAESDRSQPVPALTSGRLELVFEPSSFAAGRIDEGVLRASLDERSWLELELRTSGSFGRASARAAGDLDELLASDETRLEVAFEELDLGALGGNPEQTTRLTGAGSVRLGAPVAGAERELQVDFTLEPSRIARIDLERGRLRGGLRGAGGLKESRWRVDELELHGAGVSVSGSGSGTAGVLENATLSARIERLDALSSWLPARQGAGARVAGRVDVRLELTGAAGQLAGRAELDARGLVFDGRAVGDLDLRARVAGRRATLERFELRGGRVALSAEPGGVVRLRDPGEIGSTTEPIALESLRLRSDGASLALDGAIGARSARDLRVRISKLQLVQLVPESDVLQLRAGQVDAVLTFDGPFDEPGMDGTALLAGGVIAVAGLDEPFGPIEGRAHFERGALVIERLSLRAVAEGSAGPAAEYASATGRIALAGLRPGALDLRLTLDDFPLTRIPLFFGASLPNDEGAEPMALETGGRIDADLRVTGDADVPRVTGDLEWTHPRWESLELDRISAHVEGDAAGVDGTVRVDYAGREVLTARFELPVPETVQQPLDWLRDERARIDVRGDALDFALLSPFLTRLVRDPRGVADVELRIRGGTPEPLVSGSVRVADGSIRAPLLRQTFAPVSGVAHFDGRRIRLESLAIGPPETGLRAEGTLELEDLRPARIDVAFALTSFPLSRSSLFETNVGGNLRLAGEALAPALTGSLELQRTRVTIRSAQDPVYKEVRIRTSSAEDGSMRENAAAKPGLLERASVDIALQVPGDTWIRSPEMELDVKGWGRIEKRPFEPARVSGTLEALRGTVRVVAKKFAVRSGRAELDGDADLDPVLDVEATHPVADVLIVAHVTGRASNPTLQLTSEPEMDEQEVVSYLFFGRPSEQLGASQQGGVDLAAAGLAAGMALDELREIFGTSFPVDTVDLRLQEGDEPSRIEIGKYVTKDVFVRIGQSFGPEQTQEVGVSYRIDENWRVESDTSSNATAGADVFWTIDY